MSGVIEDLTEAECRLYALMQDYSGLDLAEMTWWDPDNTEDGCWRAWPFQWDWFRCTDPLQIDQMARSVGKTLSITLRMFAFPFLFPGQEAVITAPELVHLEPLTNLVERRFQDCRLGKEMLPGGRSAVTHRPFMMNFVNGSRIIGRLPQRDGHGVKGCMAAGSLILTDKGYVNIEDLRVGDLVLTHLGRWRPVEAIEEDINDCFEVTGQSSFPMTVSCDHRFLGVENLAGPKQKRRFDDLLFHGVEQLIEHQVYWATPTVIPTLPVASVEFGGSATIIQQRTEEFWWLVGRYLADGYLTNSKRNGKERKIHWAVHSLWQDEILVRLAAIGLASHVIERDHSSANIVTACSAGWHRWLSEHFGELSHAKKLPAFVLGMDETHRRALLNGYLAGDGHYSPKRDRIEVGTASKSLVVGIQQLAQTLGHPVNCSVVQPKVTEIMGVALKNPPRKSWRLQILPRGHGHPTPVGNHMVARVRSVVPVGKRKVFNPIVAEDHSYLSGSIVSHNVHPIWLELDEACFPAGTLILTSTGLRDIIDVVPGMLVWTHKNRWRPVLATRSVGVRETVKVVGQGLTSGLQVTGSHRLWAQRAKYWKKGGGGWEWMSAADMTGHYWSSPLYIDATTSPCIPLAPTNVKRPVNHLDPRFLFLMGVWIAEGSVSSGIGAGGAINRATWSVTPDEAVILQKEFEALGLHVGVWPVTSSDECVNVVLNHAMVARWLAQECGKGAHSKQIPLWVYGLPEDLRVEVLNGVVFGDGFDCKDPRYAPGRWKLTTTSKRLMVGSRLLAQSLGYLVSAYGVPPPKGKRSIRGRDLKSGSSYQIVGGTAGEGYDEGGLRLTKVRRVEPMGEVEVFDLTVAEDASFVADGVVVHNSDYPKDGWTELIETLKRGHDGAVWRAHGVTRGIRDKFYEFTQESPTNPWTVHRRCLPEGTLVYGTERAIPIEELQYGDELHVIDKEGQLASDTVIALVDNGVQPTWKVEAKGGHGLITTWNHPYLVLRRAGTRRTRRTLQFEWVEAQYLMVGDYIVCACELPQTGDRVPSRHQATANLVDHSPVRVVPPWVWEATPAMQLAFLYGYLMGDGSLSRQPHGQEPWQIATASERMAKELRALCHYLGLRTTLMETRPDVRTERLSDNPMFRFYVYPGGAWFRQIPLSYSQVKDGQGLEGLGRNFVARRVDTSEATGLEAKTWDITVGTSHNFIAEGVVVHNTAMHRPNWTDQERTEKIQQYGSRDHPDYRRNVLGLHGDASNPLFVLHRLMRCCDDDLSSTYNLVEYTHLSVNHEQLVDRGQNRDVVEFLDFPESHKAYTNTWVGMDVGFTNHPSEIMVFGEVPMGKDKPTKLKLLTRIHLERISNPQQVRAICWVMDFYKPKAFSLDKTGVGLPLFQDLQDTSPAVAQMIRGYNFSEKILVDFDEGALEAMHEGDDDVKEAGIMKNVAEYSMDLLRELVDHQRLMLPWDTTLIAEFQGSTWSYSKEAMDMYGRRRRVYNKGSLHALDGCRMAVLGYKQHTIEEMLRMRNVENTDPVFDSFVDIGNW